MTYTYKHPHIEAIRVSEVLSHSDLVGLPDWFLTNHAAGNITLCTDTVVVIHGRTLHMSIADPKDWIIRDGLGEVSVCKEEDFEHTYKETK